jgi:hypothetical protein
MDNIQKHNTCINVPSSQILKSLLLSLRKKLTYFTINQQQVLPLKSCLETKYRDITAILPETDCFMH